MDRITDHPNMALAGDNGCKAFIHTNKIVYAITKNIGMYMEPCLVNGANIRIFSY